MRQPRTRKMFETIMVHSLLVILPICTIICFAVYRNDTSICLNLKAKVLIDNSIRKAKKVDMTEVLINSPLFRQRYSGSPKYRSTGHFRPEDFSEQLQADTISLLDLTQQEPSQKTQNKIFSDLKDNRLIVMVYY